MDQRLMVTLDIDKDGHKFIFSVPQHAPFKLALESLHEFQGQILAWQKIAEEKMNESKVSPDGQ